MSQDCSNCPDHKLLAKELGDMQTAVTENTKSHEGIYDQLRNKVPNVYFLLLVSVIIAIAGFQWDAANRSVEQIDKKLSAQYEKFDKKVGDLCTDLARLDTKVQQIQKTLEIMAK